MCGNSSSTVLVVGSVGLSTALQLYGADCVVDAGSWSKPATVCVPSSDVGGFKELEAENIAKLKSGGTVW